MILGMILGIHHIMAGIAHIIIALTTTAHTIGDGEVDGTVPDIGDITTITTILVHCITVVRVEAAEDITVHRVEIVV